MYNKRIMKSRVLSFISLLTLGLCLSSCNYINILTHKLKSIIISDATSAYLVGETYLTKCDLTITGTYSNGDKVTFNKNDVSYNLVYGSSIKDVTSPFAQEGTYKLTVSKDGITSNQLSISVFASHQYVTNIQVNSSSTIEKNASKDISLTLTVSPNKYTVPISYETSDSSIVSIKRINELSYLIRGLEIGEANLTFKGLKNASSYFETNFHVTVTPNQKVEIEQTYNDFVKKNYYNTSACPVEGEVNLLVIPIWFSDSSSFIQESYQDKIRDDINTAFFGSKEQTGWHSVSSFYEEESKGLLHINGKVSEWFTTNISSMDVSDYSTNAHNNFIKNTVNWYFDNHTSDSRTNYDSDKDGYLDGVMLIYGAPDYQVYSQFSSNMWAYCFYAPTNKNPLNPGLNVYFWASYDFLYGSNEVSSRTGGGYCNGDTRFCKIDAHTYIHETGHVFGLEDYYDYSDQSSPTAGFSMQDNNVGGHDPFSTMAFGWSNPYIPTSSCEITINDFQSSHDLILLSPNWNSANSPFDEYLLLELYTPTGLNKFDCIHQYDNNYPLGPNSIGIRLWHVDARLFTTTNKFLTDVNTSYYFYTAFNNTYLNYSESEDRGRDSFSFEISRKEDYQRFNQLHLIRSDVTKGYLSKADLSAADLFTVNTSFDMTTYSSQFYKNNGKLNSGLSLGWSFYVKNITNVTGDIYSATIRLTKV